MKKKDYFFFEVKNKITAYNKNLLFIHSDLLFGFKIKIKPFDKTLFLEKHFQNLQDLAPSASIWMPSFNYDFTKNKQFDLQKDPSQVGHLTEFFRIKKAIWRSEMPIFNVSGTGEKIKENDKEILLDCFGTKSFFQELVDRDALILQYGSPFEMSMTIMHYCERLSGKLLYRYDKFFDGVIKNKNHEKTIKLKYHVRPMNGSIQYDWKKIQKDLEQNNIIEFVRSGKSFIGILEARKLAQYLIFRMQENPFYLLDKATFKWVEPKIQKLGRAFILSDFE